MVESLVKLDKVQKITLEKKTSKCTLHVIFGLNLMRENSKGHELRN